MSDLGKLGEINAGKAFSRRKAEMFIEGRHEPLYSMEMFLLNQQIRAAKGTSPGSANKTSRVYLLTGIGLCYECWLCNPYQHHVSLRGSTTKNYAYYRCAATLEHFCPSARADNNYFASSPGSTEGVLSDLLGRHKVLPAKKLEGAVEELIAQIHLPDSWYREILAFVITRHGMTEFERETYNLRAELERLIKLFKWEHIGEGEYLREASRLKEKLQQLTPEATPIAQKAIPLLKDFSGLWKKMLPIEQRAVLKTIFAGLYFDSTGALRKAVPEPAFKDLICFEKGGGHDE